MVGGDWIGVASGRPNLSRLGVTKTG